MLCLPQACGKQLRRGAEGRAHNDDRRPHGWGACVKQGNSHSTTVCVNIRFLEISTLGLCPILWLYSCRQEVFLSGTPSVSIGLVAGNNSQRIHKHVRADSAEAHGLRLA